MARQSLIMSHEAETANYDVTYFDTFSSEGNEESNNNSDFIMPKSSISSVPDGFSDPQPVPRRSSLLDGSGSRSMSASSSDQSSKEDVVPAVSLPRPKKRHSKKDLRKPKAKRKSKRNSQTDVHPAQDNTEDLLKFDDPFDMLATRPQSQRRPQQQSPQRQQQRQPQRQPQRQQPRHQYSATYTGPFPTAGGQSNASDNPFRTSDKDTQDFFALFDAPNDPPPPTSSTKQAGSQDPFSVNPFADFDQSFNQQKPKRPPPVNAQPKQYRSRNSESQGIDQPPSSTRRGSKKVKRYGNKSPHPFHSDGSNSREAESSASESGETSDGDSDSSSDMSEGEWAKRQREFHANATIAPPTKSSQGAKSRASAPVSINSPGKSNVIKERKVGVDVKKEGTGTKVKQDIAKSSARSPHRPSGKAPNPPQKKFDVLPELMRGTALLKYGRRGYPHFRQFNLSSDHSKIIWFSNKKKLDKSCIDVADIDEVLTGQHTKEFRRIAWTTLAPASFSIIYDRKQRSLNLVAKSVDEMKMWVQSLRLLRDRARKGHNLKDIRELLVDVDFRDRNRPQSRKHSGHFLRGHETKEREVDELLYRKLVEDMEALRKLFQQVSTLSKHEVIRDSEEGKSVHQILSELEERIEELEHEITHTRNTKIAENDVWRTRIDLESLREKIKVLIKQNKKNKDKGRRWSVF